MCFLRCTRITFQKRLISFRQFCDIFFKVQLCSWLWNFCTILEISWRMVSISGYLLAERTTSSFTGSPYDHNLKQCRNLTCPVGNEIKISLFVSNTPQKKPASYCYKFAWNTQTPVFHVRVTCDCLLTTRGIRGGILSAYLGPFGAVRRKMDTFRLLHTARFPTSEWDGHPDMCCGDNIFPCEILLP